MREARSSDVHVAVHAGGVSSGVGESKPLGWFERAKESVWAPLAAKVVSVTLGMAGLAAVGVIAGAPKTERLELMGMVPGLGETWLAGGSASQSATPSPTAVAPLSALSSRAQTHPGAEQSEAAGGSSEPQGVTADGKVILNTASVAELTRLPGVGQKRAEKIVALRERLKRFRKPTDLLRVKGIGPKSLRKMLPHLVLDPPEPPKPSPVPSTSGSGGSSG